MNDQKSAMPPGFGESEKPTNRSTIGAPVLVSAVVAAVVSAVVAFGVGRAGGPTAGPSSSNPPGVDPSRLTVLGAQQAKFDERLTAVEFKAPAPSTAASELAPEQRARAVLEARMAEGGASPEELKMLRAICRQQRDEACADRVTEAIRDGGVGALPAKGFDRASAVRALSDAAAVARICGRHEGRDVRARVTVTFDPSGKVSDVEVVGEEPRKEKARKCLQTVFREAKTTPFEGGPVKVAKIVTLDGSSPPKP